MFDRTAKPARFLAKRSRSSSLPASRAFDSMGPSTDGENTEFDLPPSRPFTPEPSGNPPVIQRQPQNWWERNAPKVLGGKDAPDTGNAGLSRTPWEKKAPYLLGGKAPNEDRNYYQRNAWSILGGREVGDGRNYWQRAVPTVLGGKEVNDKRSYYERVTPALLGGKETNDKRSYSQRTLPSWAGGKEAHQPINEIQRDFPDLRPDYAEDLQKIHSLVRDPVDMVGHLQELDREVGKGRGGPGGLSAALSAKEQQHQFSDAKVLPLGILPTKTFLDVTRKGYMPKDPGAGLEHGEYAHRLQWNAIMSKFEQDMAASRKSGQEDRAWKHTPFELYTAIGERDYQDVAQHGEEGHQNLWSHLMDSEGKDVQGEGTDLAVDYPKGFSQPDALTAFLNIEATRGGGKLPNVASAAHARYEKRAGPVRRLEGQAVTGHQEVTAWAEQEYETAETLPTSQQSARNKEISDLYNESSARSQKAIESARQDAAKAYEEKKTRKGSKYEPIDPQKPEQPLLIQRGDRRMTEADVARRRQTSRTAFGLG